MSLTLDHGPHWSTLTLDRPPRNELDRRMLAAILAACDELDERGSPPLHVAARGKHFSTGYPIGEIPETIFHRDPQVRAADPFERVMLRLVHYSAPVVASIQGDAYGGALELLACADLRLAAAGVRFGLPPARLGLVYSHTGLRRLIRTCGSSLTRELVLTGEAVSAERAHGSGFLCRVVVRARLREEAEALLAAIAKGTASALRGTRRVLNLLEESETLTEAALGEIAELRHASRTGAEFRAAQQAFLAGRSTASDPPR